MEYNWDELSRQPMLSVLQALIRQPMTETKSSFYSAADLHAIVLKRWYELDPEGAARQVAVELASSDAALSAQSVGLLPGGPHPQLEEEWARELGESESNDRQTLLGALLVRFGTGSATAQVESKVNSLVGKWACAPQTAALAYIVKFNSDNAASLAHRAMTAMHDTRCYETVFSSVSAYAHGPALNEAAVNNLQNADPRAAADAAEYLRYFGTEFVKQPLLDRYRSWNEQWADKPAEIDLSTASGYPNSLLGQSLGEALIANQGWLADSKLIADVLSHCLGEQVCREMHELESRASSPTPNVSLGASTPVESYRIGQYSSKSKDLFEAKLAQFPAGTKFILIPTSPRNGDQLRLEQEAQALFTKHGMTLEVATQP